jgi:hypothetical protein
MRILKEAGEIRTRAGCRRLDTSGRAPNALPASQSVGALPLSYRFFQDSCGYALSRRTQMNLVCIAPDGSSSQYRLAALSAQGFSANYPFKASTQLQLGLGIPLST